MSSDIIFQHHIHNLLLVGLPCRPSSTQTRGCRFPFLVEQSSCLESTIHPELDVKIAANNLDKLNTTSQGKQYKSSV